MCTDKTKQFSNQSDILSDEYNDRAAHYAKNSGVDKLIFEFENRQLIFYQFKFCALVDETAESQTVAQCLAPNCY